MAFNGSEGGPIPLDKASAWTANYRKRKANEVKAHYFGKDIINKILGQNGCVGIRMYYALNDGGEKQLVLVGVDAEENDLFRGVIADLSFACPPSCPDRSPLGE